VVRVAGEAAALLDTQVAVVNPTPIRWGQPLDKSDGELATQARALQTLAERLAVHGVRLAYHTHDAEMRHAAREFHHMLLATDPAVVGLCLDAHWIYRGAGNSQVALFDIVQLYGSRVVSLHLRQSRNGVWTETLDEADGADLDYARLAHVAPTTWLRGRSRYSRTGRRGRHARHAAGRQSLPAQRGLDAPRNTS
jgi:inosose dehydratase